MTALERLKDFITAKGWKTADLAREAHVDHSTISKIITGKRSAGLAVAAAIEVVTADWEAGPIRAAEWLGAPVVDSGDTDPEPTTFAEIEAAVKRGAA
jgi:transcriptional regulator with XRE-family HTH domain